MSRKFIISSLLALILFHFVNNYFWCAKDWLTMEDDMRDHLYTHLRVYNGLKDMLTFSDSPVFTAQR